MNTFKTNKRFFDNLFCTMRSGVISERMIQHLNGDLSLRDFARFDASVYDYLNLGDDLVFKLVSRAHDEDDDFPPIDLVIHVIESVFGLFDRKIYDSAPFQDYDRASEISLNDRRNDNSQNCKLKTFALCNASAMIANDAYLYPELSVIVKSYVQAPCLKLRTLCDTRPGVHNINRMDTLDMLPAYRVAAIMADESFSTLPEYLRTFGQSGCVCYDDVKSSTVYYTSGTSCVGITTSGRGIVRFCVMPWRLKYVYETNNSKRMKRDLARRHALGSREDGIALYYMRQLDTLLVPTRYGKCGLVPPGESLYIKFRGVLDPLISFLVCRIALSSAVESNTGDLPSPLMTVQKSIVSGRVIELARVLRTMIDDLPT